MAIIYLLSGKTCQNDLTLDGAISPEDEQSLPPKRQRAHNLAADGVYLPADVTTSRCALLPHSFHPYPCGRYCLCGTFPTLAGGRCYRPRCPLMLGLSSVLGTATVWPAGEDSIGAVMSPDNVRRDDLASSL